MCRTTWLKKILIANACSGSVAVTVGVMIPVIFGVAGLAIDSTRLYHARSLAQSAMDAGMLAAAKGGSCADAAGRAAMEDKAEEYFRANFPEGMLGSTHSGFTITVTQVTLPDGTTTVCQGQASAITIPTTILRAVSSSSASVAPMAQVVTAFGIAEVAIAVDMNRIGMDPSVVANAGRASTLATEIDRFMKAVSTAVGEPIIVGPTAADLKNRVRWSLIPYSDGINLACVGGGTACGSTYDNWMTPLFNINLAAIGSMSPTAAPQYPLGFTMGHRGQLSSIPTATLDPVTNAYLPTGGAYAIDPSTNNDLMEDPWDAMPFNRYKGVLTDEDIYNAPVQAFFNPINTNICPLVPAYGPGKWLHPVISYNTNAMSTLPLRLTLPVTGLLKGDTVNDCGRNDSLIDAVYYNCTPANPLTASVASEKIELYFPAGAVTAYRWNRFRLAIGDFVSDETGLPTTGCTNPGPCNLREQGNYFESGTVVTAGFAVYPQVTDWFGSGSAASGQAILESNSIISIPSPPYLRIQATKAGPYQQWNTARYGDIIFPNDTSTDCGVKPDNSDVSFDYYDQYPLLRIAQSVFSVSPNEYYNLGASGMATLLFNNLNNYTDGPARFNIGLQWAWYALSPMWRGKFDGTGEYTVAQPADLNYPRDYGANSKLIILIAQGGATGASAIPNYDNLILPELCTTIKGRGIKIAVIDYYKTAEATVDGILSNCATPGMYYADVNSAAALQNALGTSTPVLTTSILEQLKSTPRLVR